MLHVNPRRQVWLSEKQILIEAEERRRKEAEDLHLQRSAGELRSDMPRWW